MSKTLIYAHRGANREAAENTRAAFERALAYPIDGIETDVQLSRDEVAVLWHDRDLKKLGLPGKRIDDYDYRQLQEMDFAAHFAGAQAEGVMSLQDFVAAYRARCGLLLEIKNRDWEEVARHEKKVRQTLVLAGGGMLVSSFNASSLVYAHGVAPDFPLVLNLEPEHTVNDARRALDDHPFLHGLCVEISTLDVDMVGLLRSRHKSIAVYTCDSDAEIERALTLEVDILISDVPHKALQMRDR
jgi:glycerophosphoryl diester phosphodiesterase